MAREGKKEKEKEKEGENQMKLVFRTATAAPRAAPHRQLESANELLSVLPAGHAKP